ncbi:MAG: hypothetical protein ABJG99_09795 [Crocinitomicaceae bacterium]
MNRINFKLFFYLIIPTSTLILAAITNFYFLELPTKASLSLMFSQLIAPYVAGGVWVFLYAKVREIFIDGRKEKVDTSNPIHLFTFNKQYMNLSNYMIFVFAAWLLFSAMQFVIMRFG